MNESTLKNIADELRQDPRIQAAFLHGSAVEGILRPDSDVDLALLLAPDESISTQDILELSGKLTSVLGRRVDIGVMDHTNLVYEKEVVCHGQCIFCRDESYRDEFMAHTLSMYVQLRFERRDVERSYGMGETT